MSRLPVYGSEKEGMRGRMRQRRVDKAWEMRRSRVSEEGKEEIGGYGGEMVRAKGGGGGGRRLCMDMEEVKACRDLGFDLQQDFIDDDSSCSSPMADWRISSSGEDPTAVKARLKVWAQAVALASTSRFSR